MQIRTTLALLLLCATSAASIRSVKPLEVVVPRTDHIVRGEVDLSARTVTITHRYRGKIAEETIRVWNLRDFDPVGGLLRGRRGEPEHPTHAILLLQEQDGRYYLVHERTPGWIAPHSSVYYVSKEGKVQGYLQQINPGPVSLVDRYKDLATFEKELGRHIEGLGPRKDRRRTSLTAGELGGFYETIAPYVDYYRREVARPGEKLAPWSLTTVIDAKGPEELERYVNRLVAYVRKNKGEARSRGIEVLLMLGEQKGPDQSRREAVESSLLALVGELGPETFVPVFLGEIATGDVYANWWSPARLLRRIGGETADRAADSLRKKILGNPPTTLASRCYQALKCMGRVEEAEAAWAECERREAERRKAEKGTEEK